MPSPFGSMLRAARRIILLVLVLVGAWIWGHWVSLLVGVVAGAALWWLWSRQRIRAPASAASGWPTPPRPNWQHVEGYGWLRR